MANVFVPSCKNPIFYPEAHAKLTEYLFDKGFIDQKTGCCKKININNDLSADDTAIVLCNTCNAIVEESQTPKNRVHVFDLILNDDDFPFADFDGEEITVQDCCRARSRHDLHDTVRKLLQKMNFKPINLDENPDDSCFCGISTYMELPQEVLDLAPKRFTSYSSEMFVPQSAEEQETAMKKQAARIKTQRVVSYCFSCDASLKMGGADSLSMLNLLFKVN